MTAKRSKGNTGPPSTKYEGEAEIAAHWAPHLAEKEIQKDRESLSALTLCREREDTTLFGRAPVRCDLFRGRGRKTHTTFSYFHAARLSILSCAKDEQNIRRKDRPLTQLSAHSLGHCSLFRRLLVLHGNSSHTGIIQFGTSRAVTKAPNTPQASTREPTGTRPIDRSMGTW